MPQEEVFEIGRMILNQFKIPKHFPICINKFTIIFIFILFEIYLTSAELKLFIDFIKNYPLTVFLLEAPTRTKPLFNTKPRA